MSKAVKISFVILGVLAIVAILFAGATLSQKAQLEKNQKSLEKMVEDTKNRELKLIKDNKQLTEKVDTVTQEKQDLNDQLRELRSGKLADLEEEIDDLRAEKEIWVRRLEDLRKERDQLVEKLKEKPEKEIVYIEREPEPGQPAQAQMLPPPPGSTPEAEEESYWAGVLRDKANLQLEVQSLQQELANAKVELVEIKKKNSDMQLELSEVKNQKEAIEHEIKRGKDLADTLSLEVARIQNEKKFLDNRLMKVGEENDDLREKIKQLTSTKIALEKSIVRMQDEKKNLEDKLIETENVIQNRIDEIWEIKKGIDETFRPAKARQKGEVELTPIVVSASGETEKYPYPYEGKGPGFEGNIVSVNDDNNFVIVDVGKTDGLRLGDSLGVYRGAEYVAGLEVIQIRDDIAAADIKNKVSTIQVGDAVR